jgi:hypothetical protein
LTKEVKPIVPTTTQITIGTPPLLAKRTRSINAWEDKDALALTIINSYVDNSIISHIQSC